MTKWIGNASLTMWPPWRIVLSYRFHIGRASLCSPFYEVIGRIDENLDPGRRQAHVRRARLLILTRHSFVEKERRVIEVEPSDAVKVPQLAGAKRLRVPADRCGSVGDDQHHREGWARSRVAHSHSGAAPLEGRLGVADRGCGQVVGAPKVCARVDRGGWWTGIPGRCRAMSGFCGASGLASSAG